MYTFDISGITVFGSEVSSDCILDNLADKHLSSETCRVKLIQDGASDDLSYDELDPMDRYTEGAYPLFSFTYDEIVHDYIVDEYMPSVSDDDFIKEYAVYHVLLKELSCNSVKAYNIISNSGRSRDIAEDIKSCLDSLNGGPYCTNIEDYLRILSEDTDLIYDKSQSKAKDFDKSNKKHFEVYKYFVSIKVTQSILKRRTPYKTGSMVDIDSILNGFLEKS